MHCRLAFVAASVECKRAAIVALAEHLVAGGDVDVAELQSLSLPLEAAITVVERTREVRSCVLDTDGGLRVELATDTRLDTSEVDRLAIAVAGWFRVDSDGGSLTLRVTGRWTR